MTISKKDESFVEDLRKHSEISYQASVYSMQRIDLLIISVSGAGIYVCLEILKYLHDNKLSINNTCFKIIGLLFGISIILNFISQWASYYANQYNRKSSKQEIYDIEYKKDNKSLIADYDCYVKVYGYVTKSTNILSTIAMLSGLVFIIVCIWVIF